MNLAPLLFLPWVFFAPSMGNKLNVNEPLFEEFIKKFDKTYSSDFEKYMKLQTFLNNLEEINRLNSIDTATYGINQFADLTKEEFKQRNIHEVHAPMTYRDCDVVYDGDIITNDAPSSLDWRSDKIVTEVKNQLKCEASWAFALIGNIEGQYAKKYGNLKQFSEQQLIDCLIECDGCRGCSSSTTAMSSLVKLGGVKLEEDYPYEGKEQCCRDDSNAAVKVAGCTNYDLSEEKKLMEVLAKKGPLYIAINSEAMKHYSKGIIKDCPDGELDMAVLLVGYGTEDGVDYWLIKNSWGETWGESGYAKIRRGVNACGLLNRNTASVTIK